MRGTRARPPRPGRLPVAFHCIFILGFQDVNARVLTHSIMGSFVYGVFAVKMFFVHDRDHPLELTGARLIGPRGWLRGNNDPPAHAPP